MKKIYFSDNFYEVAIFLDGDLPNFDKLQELIKTKKIAADGAANRMIKANFLPDLIIGDMDSLDSAINNIEIIKDSDQNTNDFEKILIYLIKNNYKKVIVLGLHGGILEHTLNNISIFLKYESFFDSFIIYDKDRYGIFIDQSIEIALKKDEIISIIPNPECNIKTEGLVWELNDEFLELGKREGARNKCKSDKINIWLNNGSYFLFFESRFPEVVEFR